MERKKLSNKVIDIEVLTESSTEQPDNHNPRSSPYLKHKSTAKITNGRSKSNQKFRILLLFLKIIFLIFIGMYILTLPAYYFFSLHTVSDSLMPFEVVLCFASSFVSFVWVLKTTLQLNREMRRVNFLTEITASPGKSTHSTPHQ